MSGGILKAVAAVIVAVALGSVARAEDTIKIGYTDPLSGPYAQTGQYSLQTLQYAVDYINANGGALGRKFEIVSYDDGFQPSEALIALKSMADQNIPFVLQFAGSHVAAALIDAVEKHNDRNPDRRVLYLNAGAVATDLTNDKCSFWHFRFDANAEQKALMLVRALLPDIKRVYLLNQDYLFGQSVKRDVSRFLAEYRPDITIVGNELIPVAKIKDFSPYISKIKASEAQALITGNGGPDFALLMKAAMDAGLDVKYYAFYASSPGGPTAIGPRGDGRVLNLLPFNENAAFELGDPALKQWVAQFRATHDFDFFYAHYRTLLEFLQAAINKVGSTDAARVAQALEGMSRQDMLGHEVTMRAEDHQILPPYYVSVFSKAMRYDTERTGLGWKPVKTYEGKDLALHTTCKMKRPTS